MDIPAVIDYVIVQTSRGKSKSDYLKSFTGLIDVNLNSFSDILTQINQGMISATKATQKRQPFHFSIFVGSDAKETTLCFINLHRDRR